MWAYLTSHRVSAALAIMPKSQIQMTALHQQALSPFHDHGQPAATRAWRKTLLPHGLLKLI
jgi:hypothetical protein